MAEGGVMVAAAANTTASRRKMTSPPERKDYWIVLTPSVDHEAWLKALISAATAAGRELVSTHVQPEPRPAEASPVVYVTHDALVAADVDPADVVVIMAQPETAAETTADLYDLYPPYNVFHASLLLARAASLGEPARVLTAHQLGRNPANVELFPGLVVQPPTAERGTPRPAVSTALGMYRLGRPHPGTSVSWSERLFTYDPTSCVDDAPLGVLDVTGRPRTLFYGPYLALPAGRWKAVMRIAIDESAASHELRFDWGLGADFVSQTAVPNDAGVYEIEIEHTVSEVGPWQFRVLLMQGAFDGRMTFQGGTVTLLPAID